MRVVGVISMLLLCTASVAARDLELLGVAAREIDTSMGTLGGPGRR